MRRGFQRGSIALAVLFIGLMVVVILQPETSADSNTLYRARATAEMSALKNTETGETFIISRGQSVQLIIPDAYTVQALRSIEKDFSVSAIETDVAATRNTIASALRAHNDQNVLGSFIYTPDSGWVPVP